MEYIDKVLSQPLPRDMAEYFSKQSKGDHQYVAGKKIIINACQELVEVLQNILHSDSVKDIKLETAQEFGFVLDLLVTFSLTACGVLEKRGKMEGILIDHFVQALVEKNLQIRGIDLKKILRAVNA